MRALACLSLALVLAWAGVGSVAAATDVPGRILFVADGDLWVLDASGPHQLATGGSLSQPSWAPDGSSLAYVFRGNNFADIFTTDDQGQSQTRLTNTQSTVLDNNDWNLRPTFSPDGQLIAYVSDHNSAFPTLWLMDAADGTGRHAVATPGLTQEAVDSMAWSPDGSQLAVTLFDEPGPTQIALVPMLSSSREQARLLTSTDGGALDPAWSPDGAWLAFAGHDGEATDIFAMRPDGSGLTRLTADKLLARAPAWSPDGQHLAYLSNRTGYYEVFEVDVQSDPSGAPLASAPRQLTQDLHVDATSGLSWGR